MVCPEINTIVIYFSLGSQNQTESVKSGNKIPCMLKVCELCLEVFPRQCSMYVVCVQISGHAFFLKATPISLVLIVVVLTGCKLNGVTA